MRVLFATISEKSHLYNMVPLAWALRSAGHEVRVASHPALTPTTAAAGLPAVPVGTDHRFFEVMAQYAGTQLEEAAKTFDPFTMPYEELTWEFFQGFYGVTVPVAFGLFNDPLVDGLVEFAKEWQPDLVLWDGLTYSGAVAAKVCGAAHARLLWGSDIWSPLRDKFLARKAEQPEDDRHDPMIAWLEPIMERHGSTFDEVLTSGHFSLHQLPASLRTTSDHNVNHGLQFVAYNGSSAVPDWLREPPTRRRICLTLGTTLHRMAAGDFVRFSDLLEAVSDLDVEVIATLSEKQRAAVDKIPDNVRAVEFAPLNVLLPTCSAIVHHGGGGTHTTSLRYGVPQLVLPQVGHAETYYQAKRLEATGAGLYEQSHEVTPDGLRKKVERLLTEPSFAENAARLRQEMLDEPSPAAMVPVLEELTAKYRA
ncbi:activator-dependent family glycosyltransferase [Streptomyces californicus]|uniref:activator-dependent family glycosyltransferase n=1 Tax=Streptomyces TaxID=1883 RepID=UPI0015CF5B94|nr:MULTISPECIES: activator-dependent family glycosyltransferase [Streptomyces]MCF3170511.1 activator-dependent family glycosyltransferase [Streptomyces violaceoruber]